MTDKLTGQKLTYNRR